MPTLYQPEKYKVFIGKGTSIGLCTAWNEPELVFKKSETVQEKVLITGTLYSRQGVNIILRNLALNPHIRRLFLWANGSLSNTQFGIMGWSILKAIWKDGILEDGTVHGTSFKLEKEIDAEVVKKIIDNVELHDMSNESFGAVEEKIEKEKKEQSPYMEPIGFPDPVQEKVDMFPSEEVGWLVRGRTVLDAWSRVLERIMRYGNIKGTQYGYKQRELIGITWVVTNEDPTHPDLSLAYDWPEELKQIVGTTEDAIRQYHAIFLSPHPPQGIAYTYGNRLMRYPNGNSHIDQIEEVLVKELKDSRDTRRAVATTMVPSIDKDSKEPPCITQVQTIQSHGKLHFLATVRSHDIFKAAIPNVFGLLTLQKTVSEKVGFGMGNIQITSQSAHIYEQDWENALKLVRCKWWEREPSLVFDPAIGGDPRGNMIITIQSDHILLVFQSSEGQELMQIQGKTAKEISLKIAHLDLLSKTDHMMDVAMELQKAEIAYQKKIPYHQDKPLVW